MNGDLTMEIAKLSDAVTRTLTERRLLIGTLEVALDFIADQIDTVDGPDGEPMPNAAMRIASDIRQALRLCGVQA